MNIETGKYVTVDEFADDVRLMISNCLRYNKQDSPIITQARKLRVSLLLLLLIAISLHS